MQPPLNTVGERREVIIDFQIKESTRVLSLVGQYVVPGPDCDGVVHIEDGEAAVEILSSDLVDSFCYEMIGDTLQTHSSGEETTWDRSCHQIL